MELDMKVNSKIMLNKVMVLTLIILGKNILDNSIKIKNMEKANLLRQMEQKDGENGRMGKEVERT